MRKAFYLLHVLCFLMLLYALYEVFMIVPNERVMGPVQRIFYFHVACAISSYCSMVIVFLCSIFYLRTHKYFFDACCEAASEVGFVFCTCVLISGMIWAHSAWNTWFRWEPRLVTFLFLWLIFMSFNVLRAFADTQRIASHNALLGIVGALTVPAVLLSVNLLPRVAQLHPALEKGGLEPEMKEALFISIAAVVSFQFLLVYLRAKIGLAERKATGIWV